MMFSKPLTFVVLFVAVVLSALAVVYAQHESRKLFQALQTLQGEQDQLEVEWGQLQLEQSTWAVHSRVERLARAKLDMHIPTGDQIVLVTQ